jgi:ABC-type uncharacterized transport system permease subunit
MEILEIFANPNFWFGVLRATTPILFAAMAALIASRAGITNLAIEGIMSFGALFAVIGSWLAQSAWVGLLFSIIVGVILALFLAYFKLKMKADEIMVAIAINLLSAGGTIFILFLITGDKSTSAALNSVVLPNVAIPILKDIPFIGQVLSGHNILVYMAFIMVFALHYFLFKTPLGLRIRSVGGNEHAAESVGVYVHKTKYIGLALSGMLAGFAGAFMSLGYLTVFTRGMVAGRGFIGLAAANVGGRAPIGTMFASILFGFFDSLGNSFQRFSIPNEFIFMIPYVATIIMYAFFSYRRITEKKRLNRKLVKKELKEKVNV